MKHAIFYIAILIATCYGIPTKFKIKRDINFRLEFEENVQKLKDCGAYELVGKQFEGVYDHVESQAEEIYQKVETVANAVSALHSTLLDEFLDIWRAMEHDTPGEIAHYEKRIQELVKLIEQSPKNPSQYTEMRNWTEQFKNQSLKLFTEAAERTVDGFSNNIDRFRPTLDAVGKMIPTEKEIDNQIFSGIAKFQSGMKLGATVFNRRMKTLVQAAVNVMASDFDREAIKTVGIIKLNDLKKEISYRTQEFYRILNNVYRNIERKHDDFAGKLARLERQFDNFLSEFQQFFAFNKGSLIKAVRLIEKFSKAEIWLIENNGNTPLHNNDHVPYYGPMTTEKVRSGHETNNTIELEVTGMTQDGKLYRRDFTMKLGANNDEVTEQYFYENSNSMKKYVFQY